MARIMVRPTCSDRLLYPRTRITRPGIAQLLEHQARNQRVTGSSQTDERRTLSVRIDTRYCVMCSSAVLYIVSSCKAPVTPNGDVTAFVQRSKNLSARCGVDTKHA